MAPTIMFPASTSNPRNPDAAFEAECGSAKQAGFDTCFLGLETFFGADPSIRGLTEDGVGSVLYRGWILKEDDYSRVDLTAKGRDRTLVTTPEQYLYAYHFPNWYQDIASYTPKSVWVPQAELEGVLLDLEGFVYESFKKGGAIVKDYVKSRKHEWWDACYIPDVTDEANVRRVVTNFVERQEEYLVGGLVLREFVKLKQIGIHTKSRLPLANEHRLFALNGEVFYQAPYWGEGDYSGNKPPKEVLEKALPLLQAPFLAIDVAELEDGSWTIVEINDGGTAGIPEGGNSLDFYTALRKAF